MLTHVWQKIDRHTEDFREDRLGVIGIDHVYIPLTLTQKRKQNNYSLEIKGYTHGSRSSDPYQTGKHTSSDWTCLSQQIMKESCRTNERNDGEKEAARVCLSDISYDVFDASTWFILGRMAGRTLVLCIGDMQQINKRR